MAQMIIDDRQITLADEQNILQVVRAAGIDLPTFCYHSELSVYGGCRMCIVEVEGQGVVAACHTPPADGLVVRTNTATLRKTRKMALELLLANHDRECTTCERSGSCKLQDLAQRFGIRDVRFGSRDTKLKVDTSSVSLVRDPNKCILCGDCVRMCKEIQGIGVLDFANRGSKMIVTPAFGHDLVDVQCVSCGQCSAVCPTGAMTVKSQVDEAWAAFEDPTKTVIVQIAPAVRVAIGEAFGMNSGQSALGQISTALRQFGVDRVFDTSFAADLTVIEETKEFLDRLQQPERLPQFTSCCPAWVGFVEQYFPEYLGNLSTCRSPQQMLGALTKRFYADQLGVDSQDLYVVSVMPCTAKKVEAKRSQFTHEGCPDVDLVLTTQELARLIREAGVDFASLEPTALDQPFGFATGAGMIFGVTGGVSEAVLRHASAACTGEERTDVVLKAIRGSDGIREVTVNVQQRSISVAIVHGLHNARTLLEKIQTGQASYDLIEVMACPGGCIGGAGQPLAAGNQGVGHRRGRGLYREDQTVQLHKSQQNPLLSSVYRRWLKTPGSSIAHELLHTSYEKR